MKDESVFVKDEVSNLMEKAFFLNGKAENIMPTINGKNIIHKEEFGSSIIIGLYDSLTNEEKAELKNKNVEISNIPLQKLFIYLTENSQLKEAI